MKNYTEKLVDIIVNDMLKSWNRADVAEKIKFGFPGVADLGRAELEEMIWERFQDRDGFDFHYPSEISEDRSSFTGWVEKNWKPVKT